MKLFDTLAERYRRHRAIHKYDRWLRFWLLDTVIFLVKLTLIAAVAISVVHYTPLVPGSVREYVLDWRAKTSQTVVAKSGSPSAPQTTNTDLAQGSTGEVPERTVIPASLAPDVEIPSPATLEVVTIAVALANLREGPTTGSAVLGTLPKGSKITLFNLSDRWAQVATNDENGLTGYVHMSLLEESEDQIKRQFASP